MTMRQPKGLGRKRRSRRVLGSLMERLEERILLTSDAKNVFATFDGAISNPNGAKNIAIDLSTAGFTQAQSRFVLGFQLESSGGSLDPAAIQIKDSLGRTIQPSYTNPDLAQKTQSLTVAQLGLGNYTITAGAERGTSGAFHLAVFLAGDATGDRAVDASDLGLIKQIYGARAGDGKYVVEADSNLDGMINAFDLSQTVSDQGNSTSLSPMSLTLSTSPAPVQLPDGTLVTNQSSLTASGTTEPSATVALATGSDGLFDDGSTTADSSGQYSLPVSLVAGANAIAVRSTDSFGQQVISALQISLDDQAPVIAVAGPPNGTSTNTGITVTGDVTDGLSGVASLSADVDGGTPVAGSFDASGNFSVATTQAFSGLLDGLHIVHLVAADYAGNVSAASSVSFTLDTAAPAPPAFAARPGISSFRQPARDNLFDREVWTGRPMQASM